MKYGYFTSFWYTAVFSHKRLKLSRPSSVLIKLMTHIIFKAFYDYISLKRNTIVSIKFIDKYM